MGGLLQGEDKTGRIEQGLFSLFWDSNRHVEENVRCASSCLF